MGVTKVADITINHLAGAQSATRPSLRLSCMYLGGALMENSG